MPSLSKLPIAAKHRRKDKENDENAAPPTYRKTSGSYRKPVPVASASQLAQAITTDKGWSSQLLAEVGVGVGVVPPTPPRGKQGKQSGSPPTSPLGNLRTSLRNSLGASSRVQGGVC